jgi:hypothetical protein
VAFHPSAPDSIAELKSYCQEFQTILFNRTDLLATLIFLTKLENLTNAAMKTRLGGKAGYVLR